MASPSSPGDLDGGRFKIPYSLRSNPHVVAQPTLAVEQDGDRSAYPTPPPEELLAARTLSGVISSTESSHIERYDSNRALNRLTACGSSTTGQLMEEMRQMRKLLEANTKAIEATNKKVDNLSRAFEEETAEARLHRHIVSSKNANFSSNKLGRKLVPVPSLHDSLDNIPVTITRVTDLNWLDTTQLQKLVEFYTGIITDVEDDNQLIGIVSFEIGVPVFR